MNFLNKEKIKVHFSKYLAFYFLLMAGIFLTDYRKTPGAEYIRYLGAETILTKFSLILDHYPTDHLSIDKAKVNNHWFSVKSLGSHLLQVPARALFSIVHSETTRYFLTRIFSTIFLTLLLLFIIQKKHSLLIAAVILVGTPAWLQLRYTTSDVISGALAMASIWLLEKKKYYLAGFLFGFTFLVRYQLSMFIGPFLFLYALRLFFKSKSIDGLKVWVSCASLVCLQLLINYYYFGSPFKFNAHFWAPQPAAEYAHLATVHGFNPVLEWSLKTFGDAWYLQVVRPEGTMWKWMFWFYPCLIFLKNYRYKWEYLAGIIGLQIYFYGIPFWGFRYFSCLCFLSLPILVNMPKKLLWCILLFGIFVINIPEEINYLKNFEHQPILHSKFGLNIFLSIIPTILFIFLWVYRSLKFHEKSHENHA